MCGKSARLYAVMCIVGKPYLEQDKLRIRPRCGTCLHVRKVCWLLPREMVIAA